MAQLDNAIEKELLGRLNEQHLYDDILNYSPHFKMLLKAKGKKQKESDVDTELNEEPNLETGDAFVEDADEMDDMEDMTPEGGERLESLIKNVVKKRTSQSRAKPAKSKSRSVCVLFAERFAEGRRVEIEYEPEDEMQTNIKF